MELSCPRRNHKPGNVIGTNKWGTLLFLAQIRYISHGNEARLFLWIGQIRGFFKILKLCNDCFESSQNTFYA